MSSGAAADPVPKTTEDRETITYGAVHLDVVDAERSLAFWRDLLGLAELSRSDEDVQLGVDGRALVVLHPGATRGPLRGHAGLYHVAIHLPSAEEFARVLARLAAARVPQAPTDHVFSKASYLSDPDGIQLELTLETPERMSEIEIGPASLVIRDSDGRVRGMTEPLDVDEVLSHLSDGEFDRLLPSGTTIGHVHLHVSDLEAARRFYRDVIGFHEHTFVPGIGFADLGAGGRFPHRLAINVWQGEGAQQPPPGTAGLRHFELVVEDDEALALVAARLGAEDAEHDLLDGVLSTRDPAGNALRLAAPRAREPR
jgi:catechol 2,3-dioxygenase